METFSAPLAIFAGNSSVTGEFLAQFFYLTVYSGADQRSHQSSAPLALCAGNSPVADEFPTQRPVTRSFDGFIWINGWINNRDAGDLRRHRAHYDVIVMSSIRMVMYDFHRDEYQQQL